MPKERLERSPIKPLSPEVVKSLGEKYRANRTWLEDNQIDFIPGSPSHLRQIRAEAENGAIASVLIDSGQSVLFSRRKAALINLHLKDSLQFYFLDVPNSQNT